MLQRCRGLRAAHTPTLLPLGRAYIHPLAHRCFSLFSSSRLDFVFLVLSLFFSSNTHRDSEAPTPSALPSPPTRITPTSSLRFLWFRPIGFGFFLHRFDTFPTSLDRRRAVNPLFPHIHIPRIKPKLLVRLMATDLRFGVPSLVFPCSLLFFLVFFLVSSPLYLIPCLLFCSL